MLQASDELQRRLPPDALLRGKKIFQFTARARCSRAKKWRAKSNFTARFSRCALDVAGKSGALDFFRHRIAVAGDGRAALRAELFPADLILPVERP